MRKLLVRLSHPLLRRWYAMHNARRRRYKADGLDLIVLPGVFHPGFFHSTALLSEHVAGLDLNGRSFLELGAGAGRIALVAARGGAVVTASDINPGAVENVRLNAQRNHLSVEAVQSDLFAALPQHFDIIVINPPYYRGHPTNDADRAFLAGADLDYFTRLFPELAPRLRQGTRVWMVLSADVDHSSMARIATKSGLRFTEVGRRKRWGEAQVIHSLHL